MIPVQYIRNCIPTICVQTSESLSQLSSTALNALSANKVYLSSLCIVGITSFMIFPSTIALLITLLATSILLVSKFISLTLAQIREQGCQERLEFIVQQHIQTPIQRLFFAVRGNDSEAILRIKSQNPEIDINAPELQHYLHETPLIAAASKGNTGAIEALLTFPTIKPNSTDSSGSTALMVSINRAGRRKECLPELFPMHKKCTSAAKLLSSFPQVDVFKESFEDRYKTAFSLAAENGNLEVMQLLCDRIPNPLTGVPCAEREKISRICQDAFRKALTANEGRDVMDDNLKIAELLIKVPEVHVDYTQSSCLQTIFGIYTTCLVPLEETPRIITFRIITFLVENGADHFSQQEKSFLVKKAIDGGLTKRKNKIKELQILPSNLAGILYEYF